MEELLRKYKLNTVDEIEADLKRGMNDRNRTQIFCPF